MEAAVHHGSRGRPWPRVNVAYHAVSDSWHDNLATTEQDLRRQLESLRVRGLTAVTLASALASGHGRAACITFDDALISVAERAAPLLRELRWVATVFVVTEVLDSDLELRWLPSDEPAARAELRCLTWDQLRELAGSGWEVGSHSCTHRLLSALSDSELDWELGHSRRRIIEELGQCSSISYPFGELDPRVMDAARRAGYTCGTGLAGRFRIGDAMAIPRIAISRADGLRGFNLKTSRTLHAVRTTPIWTLVDRFRGVPSPADLNARVGVERLLAPGTQRL